MINARERVDNYRKQGLEVEQGHDVAGKVYDWHAHEATTLYTVAGSLFLERKGMEPTDLMPGSEVIVASNQLHHGVVGPNGWKYIVAWDPKEAKQFDH